MKRHTLAQAAVLAASALVSQWSLACQFNQATPFTAGPIAVKPATGSWGGPFSEWVVDSNGVGLKLCTTSVTNDGNPPPCFYDPVNPANAYTQSLNRGGEAFYFLADSVFTTNDGTGALALDVVIVQGIESAFLSDPPAPGFETQFSRLRTRVNVAKPGIYYVETPWGKTRYPVPASAILPPGNGQNRSEISEPIDITFGPGSNPGLVTPFLLATPEIPGFGKAQGYIGDGLTLTNVTGSPCGQNSVRITAFQMDDITPLDINGGSNVVNNTTFTVMGTLAPAAAVPMSIGAAYYTRKQGGTTVSVMVDGSASSTAAASMIVNIGGSTAPMVRDGARFYASVPFFGATLPTSVTVTATDPGQPSTDNTQTATLTDLVTITSAVATCTASTNLCQLQVNASSSDDGSSTAGAPALKLANDGTPLVNGSATTLNAAVPGVITVRSSFGGSASKPVTIVNQ
ncbi:hypothetical protein ACWA7J_06400 [Leptothrix sp. BB-4]